MTPLAPSRARELVARFRRCRLLVVGDVMLDRFVRGDVHRISPEAPVPVVRVRSSDDHLGGAGNVAANLRALGAEVSIVSIVGADADGRKVREALRAIGADVSGLLAVDGRPTTVKTRVLAHHQQVVRIDAEENGVLSPTSEETLESAVSSKLDGASALLVSDYAKGVLGPRLLSRILPAAGRRKLLVTVDPKVPHMAHYQPATAITPNQGEAARAVGIEIRDDADAVAAVGALLGRLDVEAVLMTRGERGMLLGRREREPLAIPTLAREVFDVTGAGDTVIAVFTLALGAGAEMAEAAVLANQAASVVVGKLGTATCAPEELLAAVEREQGDS